MFSPHSRMLIALCASAIRWSGIGRDKDGRFRWGMLFLQIPVAFATGVVAHALVSAALYWFQCEALQPQ